MVFAKFITVLDRGMLVVVDAKLNLMIYDQVKLKHDSTHINTMDKESNAILKLNLIDDCHYFEPFSAKTENTNHMLNE